VAAFGVVLYHLNLAVGLTFENWLHPSIQWAFEQGFLGVDIFFVLSGFVIPFSVRNSDLTAGFLGRFALRRSLRLDPPYWTAIGVEVLLMWLGVRLGLAAAEYPSWPQFLSHLVYAQNIVGQGDIIGVFWTLAFEIQFYLGLIALLVGGRWLKLRLGEVPTRWIATVVFTGLFVVSVLGRYHVLGINIHPGFALIRWFQFFMGTCVYWVVTRRISWKALATMWIFLAAVLVIERQSVLQLTPVVTSALLWWSYERDGMATVLSNRIVQFFGTISYSLYLFHEPVGWRWIRLVGAFISPDSPVAIVVAVFGSGCVVAVAVSWALWRLIEVPSMRFSKRVGLPRRRPSASDAHSGGVNQASATT